MSPKDFQIGQTVYVTTRQNQGVELDAYLVTKVGRQWVTIKREAGYGEGRFDPVDMVVDSQTGWKRQVHLSREIYMAERRRDEAWRRLQQRVRDQFTVPAGMTIEVIERWISEFDAAKASTK